MPKSNKDSGYSQQHVLDRALERYNLELTTDDYAVLTARVQSAREREPGAAADTESTEVLLNDENGEQIWGVSWGSGQTLLCVWTISVGRVTTLLPEGTTITRRKGGKMKKGK